jgi:hypothetical protein
MCDLCDPNIEVVVAEKRRLKLKAEQFREMADILALLASGNYQPHTDSERRTKVARGIIRYLAAEWL